MMVAINSLDGGATRANRFLGSLSYSLSKPFFSFRPISAMAEEFVKGTVHPNGIAVITLDRANAPNAMNLAVTWILLSISNLAKKMAGGFVQLALKRTNTHMHIVDEFGKVWPCKLIRETDSAYKCNLTYGWLNFCKGRGLRGGTTICLGIPKDATEQIYFKFA